MFIPRKPKMVRVFFFDPVSYSSEVNTFKLFSLLDPEGLARLGHANQCRMGLKAAGHGVELQCGCSILTSEGSWI